MERLERSIPAGALDQVERIFGSEFSLRDLVQEVHNQGPVLVERDLMEALAVYDNTVTPADRDAIEAVTSACWRASFDPADYARTAWGSEAVESIRATAREGIAPADADLLPPIWQAELLAWCKEEAADPE